MVLELSFEIGSPVRIKELDIRGIVTAFFYGETGKQYQVVYFIDSDRKANYFYESELDTWKKDKAYGFELKSK